jgi:hypothetical protein
LKSGNCAFAITRFGAASAWVERFVIRRMGRLQGSLHILSRAGARVGEAISGQLQEGGPIKIKALTLRIGREGPAAIGSFLPGNAEPREVLYCSIGVLGPAALTIQVFVPENENSFSFTASLVCRPEGAGMPEVQAAGGRGGDAPSIGRDCPG